jgi:hypothetical protein
MNRQQKRKRERELKKRVEGSFVGSNREFLTLEEVLLPNGFKGEPILISGIIFKLKFCCTQKMTQMGL